MARGKAALSKEMRIFIDVRQYWGIVGRCDNFVVANDKPSGPRRSRRDSGVVATLHMTMLRPAYSETDADIAVTSTRFAGATGSREFGGPGKPPGSAQPFSEDPYALFHNFVNAPLPTDSQLGILRGDASKEAKF